MLRRILIALLCVSVFLPCLDSCGSPVNSAVQKNWQDQEEPGGQDPAGETSDPDQSARDDPDNAEDSQDAGEAEGADNDGATEAEDAPGDGSSSGDTSGSGESPGSGDGQGGANDSGSGDQPGSGNTPGGGEVTLIGAAAVQEYLDGQQENGPANPYLIKVEGIDLASSRTANSLKDLYAALSRYVLLDLSGSYGEKYVNASFENNPNKANITGIILPPGVATLEKNAFAQCAELVSADLSGVTTIEHGAFSRCYKLETLVMDEVRKINYTSNSADGAFHNCDSLTSASLPRAVEIGKKAFNSCDALATVYAPLAEIIGDGAFAGCKNLAYLYLGETPPELGEEVFEKGKPGIIYVPPSRVDTYKNTNSKGWTEELKLRVQAMP